jgi:hypothetical protein
MVGIVTRFQAGVAEWELVVRIPVESKVVKVWARKIQVGRKILVCLVRFYRLVGYLLEHCQGIDLRVA